MGHVRRLVFLVFVLVAGSPAKSQQARSAAAASERSGNPPPAIDAIRRPQSDGADELQFRAADWRSTPAAPEAFLDDRPLQFCAGIMLDDPASAPSADELPASGPSDADSEDLAKKLNNPIADLISVPLQSNFDMGGGVDTPERRRGGPLLDLLSRGRPLLRAARAAARLGGGSDRDQGFRYTLNFQPVVPISISPEWNVISRTILPITFNDDVFGTTSQGGLGDLTQSFFFSPKESKPIWGVGPVFYFPTATDDSLGAERWGMGPTGVVLVQEGPWTYGALANHIWSFARDDGRKEINSTFLQPFVAYTFKSATTLTLNTESTYDWIDNQWTVPLFAGVSQVVKIGKLPVSLQFGGRYWVEGPDTAPDWGIRFAVTFLFPK